MTRVLHILCSFGDWVGVTVFTCAYDSSVIIFIFDIRRDFRTLAKYYYLLGTSKVVVCISDFFLFFPRVFLHFRAFTEMQKLETRENPNFLLLVR
jgi:hypothetical protein